MSPHRPVIVEYIERAHDEDRARLVRVLRRRRLRQRLGKVLKRTGIERRPPAVGGRRPELVVADLGILVLREILRPVRERARRDLDGRPDRAHRRDGGRRKQQLGRDRFRRVRVLVDVGELAVVAGGRAERQRESERRDAAICVSS